jgi:monovalent cation/proton antiporter MnhG/PhaG subunit
MAVMIRQIAVDVLLSLAVVVALASVLGVAVMPDVYQKLHYVTPLATVAPMLIGLTIVVQSGWTAVAAQTWLVIFVVMAGPVVSHATIRAAKIRADGDWRVRSQQGAAPGEGRR